MLSLSLSLSRSHLHEEYAHYNISWLATFESIPRRIPRAHSDPSLFLSSSPSTLFFPFFCIFYRRHLRDGRTKYDFTRDYPRIKPIVKSSALHQSCGGRFSCLSRLNLTATSTRRFTVFRKRRCEYGVSYVLVSPICADVTTAPGEGNKKKGKRQTRLPRNRRSTDSSCHWHFSTGFLFMSRDR
jgi:hypothetical protein